MVDFVPEERATAIRQPSTANFLIDSRDRYGYNPATNTSGSFQISKQQSLLNGFFTRLAVSELAISWAVPNIVATGTFFDSSNNFVNFDVSGATTVGNVLVTVPSASYSVSDLINTVVQIYNALPTATRNGTTLAVSSTGGQVTLTMTGGTFRLLLSQNGTGAFSAVFPLQVPAAARSSTAVTRTSTPADPTNTGTDFANWQRFGPRGNMPLYLDFVCSQLTYNQALKDASTGNDDRDVLVRYYFGYTNDAPQVDSLGFPIWMGYKPFYIRREFTPPKQIRWTANQPVGVLKFEVYDDQGNLYDYPGFDWFMTVQVSEV